MVVYLVKYVDSGAIVGIFEDIGRAITFRHTRLAHYSHYQVVRRDLFNTPTKIKSALTDLVIVGNQP